MYLFSTHSDICVLVKGPWILASSEFSHLYSHVTESATGGPPGGWLDDDDDDGFSSVNMSTGSVGGDMKHETLAIHCVYNYRHTVIYSFLIHRLPNQPQLSYTTKPATAILPNQPRLYYQTSHGCTTKPATAVLPNQPRLYNHQPRLYYQTSHGCTTTSHGCTTTSHGCTTKPATAVLPNQPRLYYQTSHGCTTKPATAVQPPATADLYYQTSHSSAVSVAQLHWPRNLVAMGVETCPRQLPVFRCLLWTVGRALLPIIILGRRNV